MKKVQVTVVIVLLLGLLFTSANVFANPAVGSKPHQTPGAKATQKADDRATKDQGDEGNGQGGDDGQGGDNGPGAQATQNAIERATAGQAGNNTPAATATENPGDRATQGKPNGDRATYRGTVTAVGLDTLTLNLAGGGSKTFVVGPGTKIRIPSVGGEATLAGIHVEDQVLAQVLRNDASQTALFVKVVPAKPAPVHHVGIVTAYTPGASITIQVHTGNGSSTFLIMPDAKILPNGRANELRIGSLVTIISRHDDSGSPPTAQGIVVHPPEATEGAATVGSTPTATAAP